MGLKEKLMNIQSELKAPKAQYNSFGKYKYRSCEDILEAVKPILKKHKCVLTIQDDIEERGDRFYVKATTVLSDTETDESLSNTAFAREEAEKKGQDSSQITGTASSYARKYALNGLFLIDDTKDADTDENRKESEARGKKTEKQEKDEQHYEEVGKMKIAKIKVDSLVEKCKNDGVNIDKVCEFCKVKKPEELTETLYSNIINHWKDVLEKCK